MRRHRLLLVLSMLSLASLACIISMHTTIRDDESGTIEMVAEIPYDDPEEAEEFECSEGELPPGASVRREDTGQEIRCIILIPFDDLEGLRRLYSEESEGDILTECLEFDADRLLYAVSLQLDETDALQESQIEWRVTAPGRIQSHNGHSQQGSTISWTFDADSFANATMLINLDRPEDCPSNQLRLTYIVDEDGTGSAELIGPLPADPDRADLLVSDLAARGWGVDRQATRFVARLYWEDENAFSSSLEAVPGLAGSNPPVLQIVEDEATGQRDYTFQTRLIFEQYGPAWSNYFDQLPQSFTFTWIAPGRIETLSGGWENEGDSVYRWQLEGGPANEPLRAVTVVQPETESEVSPAQAQAQIDELGRIMLQDIPAGQVLENPSGIQSGLLTLFSPGWVNNWTNGWFDDAPRFACGDYQTMVLQWLHNMRTNDDPAIRARLEGLDYGPIQAYGGGHQAVVVYPRGTDWQQTGVVFDPWPEQRPLFFPMDDWNTLFPGPKHPGVGGENYPHMYGGDSHYEGTDIPERRQHNRRIGVNSPVFAFVEAADGRRLGHLEDGTFINEIEGADFYSLDRDDGTRSYYFGLPPGDYELVMVGTDEGDFHLLNATGADDIYTFGPQAIDPGQQARLPLDGAGQTSQLELPDGDLTEPFRLTEENFEEVDLGEPAHYSPAAGEEPDSGEPLASATAALPSGAMRYAVLGLMVLCTGGPLAALWLAVVLRRSRSA